VGVVGADIQTMVASRALKTNPNVGLHLLQYVSEVQWAIGIRQG